MPKRALRAGFFLLLSSFIPVYGSAHAPAAEWEDVVYCRKPEGNLSLKARWYPEKGFRLLVQSRETGEVAEMRLHNRGLNVWAGPGTPGSARPVPTRFRQVPELDSPKRDASLIVKFREEEWQVYLERALVGTIPAIFEPPADVFWPVGTDATLEEKVRFKPVPREEFHTDFMIEEGAPNQLYPWKIESGTWRIHTAMQDALSRPESNIARIKQVPLTPDKSPNFYSLKGGGENAIITTGYPFYDDYEYSASMQINDGKVGLVFYHADADNYYAFTIEIHPEWTDGGILELWRVKDGKCTVLRRAHAPLLLHQWYLPSIRAHTDEIVCFLDGAEVMRVSESLPPGGRIGLYANSTDEIRFDDVSLEALRKLPLKTVADARYEALFHDGTFYPPHPEKDGPPNEGTVLRPRKLDRPQILVMGRPQHRNIVFNATFTVDEPVYEVGLVCGFRSPEKPYYLFTVHRSLQSETYRLTRVRRDHAQVLECWTSAQVMVGSHNRIRLMADATEKGHLKLLRDDRMVLMLPIDDELAGGAGPYISPGTTATVHDLQYDFRRERYLEQENKNPVFQHDSFMRHWAAPEGQWIAGEEGFLWHKGDFFGDFMVRLPAIPDSEFQIGIRDGETMGPIATRVDKDGVLSLLIFAGLDPDGIAATYTLPRDEKGDFSALDYEIYREGYWIWIDINGQTVMKHRLAAEIPGTRARVSGLTLAQLARSKVRRVNVIDDFFTASPYRWGVNGGNWQIINRFQCTPSWSHMVGESADTLAALWYKKIFKGDLTLEFYAGTRHGWYERAGDLNCTVMANTTSPSSGYTVTCTEWDYNLSQNWSTLYRNGKPVDRSEKYLVPRRRKGMVRKFLNPLVAAGRPIHGAWYYIKLRKIGPRVEYYFDNEKIFEFEDENALREGLVGIWTFMQSMTLAQIKMTFTHVEPRPFEVEFLPTDVPLADLMSYEKKEEPEAVPGLTVNGYPLDSLRPEHWELTDPVGQSRVRASGMNAGVIAVEDRAGAGNMLLSSKLPAVPLASTAGWRFMLKCTKGARFNVHYSIGTVDANGTYTVTKHCFHHLTGTDFTEGSYDMTGETVLTPCSDMASPVQGWQTVTVWIPSRIRAVTDSKKGIHVRFEGFGNMQPNAVMAGINGNTPGDAYALRQFTPIPYGLPIITVGPAEGISFALRNKPGGELIRETDSIEKIQEALKEMSRDGLNSAWLKVYTRSGGVLFHDLAWVQLPEKLPMTLSWDKDEEEAVLLACSGGYPDPRFAGASLKTADAGIPLQPLNSEVRVGKLPRQVSAKGKAAGPLQLVATAGGQTLSQELDWGTRKTNRGPVLVSLDGLTPFMHTFEGEGMGKLNYTNDGRMSILTNDAVQGRVLQVRNTALNQRMKSTFTTGVSLAEFPLLQFRYRAFDMTHLTVSYKNFHYVRLGDDYANAVKVRMGHDLKLDERWHSWLGNVTDAFTREPFAVTRFTPSSFWFGSAGSPDQTGRYSKWQLDDVVYGPAVAKPEQLAFTPSYVDPDGIEAVFHAVSPGETCYADLDPAATGALNWHQSKPGEKITPAISKLPEGVHHIFVKALDPGGEESSVMDFPFLLDRTPLETSFAFGSYSDPASNGKQVSVAFKNHSQAPWAIEKADFLVQGKKSKISAWTNQFRHRAGNDQLVLNYPFIFRSYLDSSKNGDEFKLTIDNIVDGAGNPSPAVEIPFKVDYASDKTGPAWYVFYFGDSVHWFWNWDGRRDKTPAFSPGTYNTATVVHTVGQSAFLHTQTYRTNGDLSRSVKWQPTVHPWLSFRLQQPDYKAKSKTSLHVILQTADKKNYSISLTEPGKAGSELNRTQTFTWKADEWQRFSFNVRDMLKGIGVADAALKEMEITSVTFQRRGAKNKESLYLDDFFIHGPAPDPSQPDLLKWYAYDASGVASLEFSCVDAAGKVLWTHSDPERQVDLNALRAKIKGSAWLEVAGKDKAGNLSVPFWLPLGN